MKSVKELQFREITEKEAMKMMSNKRFVSLSEYVE